MPDEVVSAAHSPQIVLLTNGSTHGQAIARALVQRGLQLAAVVLERPDAAALRRRAFARLRGYGLRALAGAVVRRAAGRLSPSRAKRAPFDWSAVAPRVVTVPALDAPQAVAELRALSPDIAVLGGAPILPAELLGVPRLGTLNAHPGLLPRYRGVDVVAWAILNGDPVGVTVHLVDAGIDTGRICRTRELPLVGGETLEQVRARAEAACAELMGEVVADAVSVGRIEARAPEERFPVYRRMDEARLREVRRRLQAP